MTVAVIGGGPAGLMAAEVLASAGVGVTVYDRMPSPGRKFLMAGRGGLNLTHSEALETFVTRYGAAAERLSPVLTSFPPSALRAWCEGLGLPTFVGSSGRVFPEGMKASPLLRAWLKRLEEKGVRLVTRRRWLGWNDDGALLFADPEGQTERVTPTATLLALGGGSWPRLGSDGGWVEILARHGIPVAPLRPANCGFQVAWSEVFRQRFAGQPLKPVTLSFGGRDVRGEAMVTAEGIEGGAVYALSAALREAIATQGTAVLAVDLRPGLSREELAQRLQTPRSSQSLTNYLRKAGGLSPLAIGLLREAMPVEWLSSATPDELAMLIKAVPLRLTATCGLARAISSAGGISLAALDAHFMLRDKPGVFAAGEMLDWEAPTGGYLLQGTFSTAVAAAQGVLDWLRPRV